MPAFKHVRCNVGEEVERMSDDKTLHQISGFETGLDTKCSHFTEIQWKYAKW